MVVFNESSKSLSFRRLAKDKLTEVRRSIDPVFKEPSPVSGILLWVRRGALSTLSRSACVHAWRSYSTDPTAFCQPPAARICSRPPASRKNRSRASRRRRKTGEGPKARKACLGWNSRQDGGRLVERSGNPSPVSTYIHGDAVKHHREGAGSLSTLHRPVWWQKRRETIPHMGEFSAVVAKRS